MRDFAVTVIVVIGCIYTFKKPYIGILLFCWLSYMNPHRLSYGFAYNMPFAQITVLVLLVAMLFSKSFSKIPLNVITLTWLVFVVFMGLTTLFAYFPDQSYNQYIKVLKIQFMVLLTLMLITDMVKLNQLIWVVALSIGYYSVKGGIFTILSGGGQKVWGPSGTFIEDNNCLAVAILMVIPFAFYLRQTVNKPWLRHGLTMAIILSLFTVLGSQSRGAFIAILAVAFYFWLKNDKKFLNLIVMSIIALVLSVFMPESWYKRMDTIQTYEEDGSAMGRLNAWEYAFNVANDNLLGLGYESWSGITFAMYAPNPLDVHAAHSIYFSVLADHGWIGLIMFVLIFFMTWRKLLNIVKLTANSEALKQQNLLARMMQVSLIAYLVGGAFLSLSYFDLPWHIVSFVVLLDLFVNNSIKNEQSNIIKVNGLM